MMARRTYARWLIALAGVLVLSSTMTACGGGARPPQRRAQADAGTRTETAADDCVASEDRDGDGIADRAAGELADNDDLDGDGVANADDDDFFVLPYRGEHHQRTLEARTDIQRADVFFLVDTTGSMQGERTNLIEGLQDTIIPGIENKIADVQFGVGGLDDYPHEGYGSTGDRPFYLLREIGPHDTDDGAWSLQADSSTCPSGGDHDIGEIAGDPNGRPDLLEAVEGLACHSGVDGAESYGPALWATATGNGLSWPSASQGVPAQDCSGPAEFEHTGYPCFRSGALPIVLLFGDAAFHNGPGGANPYDFDAAPAYDEAKTALDDIGARVLGIYSGREDSSQRDHYERIAEDTGAVREDGTPLVFDIESDGSGLDTTVVDAVAELVGATPQDVTTRVQNVSGNPDGFDATQFINHITPVEGYTRDGSKGGDDHMDDETFYQVTPGTKVEFEMDLNNGVRRPPEEEADIYEVEIEVVGNDTTVLGSWNIHIAVPPKQDADTACR